MGGLGCVVLSGVCGLLRLHVGGLWLAVVGGSAVVCGLRLWVGLHFGGSRRGLAKNNLC